MNNNITIFIPLGQRLMNGAIMCMHRTIIKNLISMQYMYLLVIVHTSYAVLLIILVFATCT